MDGFKTLPKMAHFKEGGHAKKEMCGGGSAYRKGGSVEKEDEKQDKAIVKKAFGMHDKQQHEEKTDLSKLKSGGRSKKSTGTVRKFKVGGSVSNVYEAKKGAGDLDNIKKTKDIKPGKAGAPSKAAVKPAFKGSDVEKEKGKPAGHKDLYIKSKQSGKSAAAPTGAKGGPNKYAEGGEVIDMRDNKSNTIGDDVRARAMKFLETGKKDSDETPKSTAKPAPKSSPKPGPKDYSDQNDRRSKQVGYESRQNQKRLKEYDKPLEESHPEDFVTPGGILKGMLKGVVRSSEKAAAREAAREATKRAEKQAAKEAKDSDRRDAEGYSPEEAVRKIDEPARTERTEASGAMKDTFKPEEIREGFKKGGKIKKMQAGSLVGKLSDYVMGSSAQNAKAAKENAEYLKAKRMQQMAGKQMSPGENMAMGLAGMGQDSALQPAPTQPAAPTPQPTAPMGAMPAQKRGGRAGKK